MPKLWSRIIATILMLLYALTATHFIGLITSGHLAVRWFWAFVCILCGLAVVVLLAQQMVKESDAYYLKRHQSKQTNANTNPEHPAAALLGEAVPSDSVKVDENIDADLLEQARQEPPPVPEHILQRRRVFKQKWSDMVRIAELILTNPGTAIEAKEIWTLLHPDEVCTPDVRSMISNCVSAIRDMLAAEQNGWEIPKGRYVVQPVSEDTIPDATSLSMFIQHLKNADKTT